MGGSDLFLHTFTFTFTFTLTLTLFLKGRAGGRGQPGAVFSPSPLWGEGRGEVTARCGLSSLAFVGRGPG